MTIEGVTEVLFEKGTLVDLHIGKPTFQKKLRQTDLLVDDIDEKVIYLGHKKLLPPKATEKLVTLEGRARVALANRSLPFPISGARFVHVQALPDVLQVFGRMRTEWQEAVADLVQQYAPLKAQQLADLDTQCQKLVDNELKKYSGEMRDQKLSQLAAWREQQAITNRNLYPSESDLPTLFRFTWRMFKISPTAGFEELNQLSQAELAEAQEMLKADLRSWVRSASADLHRALGEAALNASSMLQKHKKLTPRNLKPLFDAFETFKAVDFTGISDFRRVIDEIRGRFIQVDPTGSVDFERTAEAINGSDMGQQAFRDLLNNIAGLAEDQVAEEAGLRAIAQTGDFSRVVEV